MYSRAPWHHWWVWLQIQPHPSGLLALVRGFKHLTKEDNKRNITCKALLSCILMAGSCFLALCCHQMSNGGITRLRRTLHTFILKPAIMIYFWPLAGSGNKLWTQHLTRHHKLMSRQCRAAWLFFQRLVCVTCKSSIHYLFNHKIHEFWWLKYFVVKTKFFKAIKQLIMKKSV